MQADVDVAEYIWYVVRIRVAPVAVICALGCTRLRKLVVVLFLLWTGFSSGMIMTSSVLKMGVKGIILCLIALTPHFIDVYKRQLRRFSIQSVEDLPSLNPEQMERFKEEAEEEIQLKLDI